jgi:hypothetical protein
LQPMSFSETPEDYECGYARTTSISGKRHAGNFISGIRSNRLKNSRYDRSFMELSVVSMSILRAIACANTERSARDGPSPP